MANTKICRIGILFFCCIVIFASSAEARQTHNASQIEDIDHAYQIKTHEEFDRLIGEFYNSNQKRRGPAILCILPDPTGAANFCADIQGPCPTQPIFFRGNNVELSPSTLAFAVLKQLYPNAFAAIDESIWHDLTTDTKKHAYSTVAIYRIRQSDPRNPMYGFDPGAQFTWTQGTPPDQLTVFYNQIRDVFHAGPLYCYPNFIPLRSKAGQLKTIRSWPRVAFPIYYEAFYLPQFVMRLGDHVDTQKLSVAFAHLGLIRQQKSLEIERAENKNKWIVSDQHKNRWTIQYYPSDDSVSIYKGTSHPNNKLHTLTATKDPLDETSIKVFSRTINSRSTLDWLLVDQSLYEQRLPVIVAHHPKADEFCRRKNYPCLDYTLFIHPEAASWHGDLLELEFTEQVIEEGSSAYFFENGIYYEASIWQNSSDQPHVFRFTVLKPKGTPTIEEIERVYKEITTHFTIGQLVFEPDHETKENSAICTKSNLPFPVVCDQIKSDYIAYNEGEAYGRVRIFKTLRDFQRFSRVMKIDRRDLLVFEQEPFDVESPFAGVVTGHPQLRLASHLSLRTARRNVPNCYIKEAARVFKKYDGKVIKITVDPQRYQIEPQGLSAYEAWWANHKDSATAFWKNAVSAIRPPRPIDPIYEELDRLTEMQDSPDRWYSRFGAKAAHLAALYQIVDNNSQLEGFAIPFYYFLEFMKSNYLDTEFFKTSIHINIERLGRSPPISLLDYANLFQQDKRFNTDSVFRTQVLDDFRDYIRDNTTIHPDHIAKIKHRIMELWPSDTHHLGYYPHRSSRKQKPIRIRFRSSSNMEDGFEFIGAGLYVSRTVCLPDELDADRSGPSRCPDNAEGTEFDPNELTIDRQLKRVWRSLYENRAVEERRYFGLPEEKAAMAILVNTAVNDELINGVAFTGDPRRIQPTDKKNYFISVLPKELNVVNPPPHVVPETHIAIVNHDTHSVEDTQVIDQWSQDNAPPPEDYIDLLSQDECRDLAAAMMEIERTLLSDNSNMAIDTTPYAKENIIFSVEFKYVEGSCRNPIDGPVPCPQPIFKQVRPFLIGPILPLQKKDIIVAATPKNLRIHQPTVDSTKLDWDASPSAYQYAIERRNGGEKTFLLIGVVGADSASFIDTSIMPGLTYEYRVKAENRFGTSQPSHSISIATCRTKPLR